MNTAPGKHEPAATTVRERILQLAAQCSETMGGDPDLMAHLVERALEFGANGPSGTAAAERQLAAQCDVRSAWLVNSYLSANWLALAALCSPRLGEYGVLPGDEVITVAAADPDTVSPIVRNGLAPVFIDITLPGYHADLTCLEAALSERSRVLLLPHGLGYPYDLAAAVDFARKHGLWLIEDCGTALGATRGGQVVGQAGQLVTAALACGPPTLPGHLSAALGCLLTNQTMVKTAADSLRDRGRDCWCGPGCENTCGRRFDQKLGTLPKGHDHQYIYSHLGLDLRPGELETAAALSRWYTRAGHAATRRRNFQTLLEAARAEEEFFLLPAAGDGVEALWRCFPLLVRPDAPFSRNQLLGYFDARQVPTTLLWVGNLTRHPAYQGVEYRVAGSLDLTDLVMEAGFGLPIDAELTDAQLGRVVEALQGVRDMASAGRLTVC